MHDPAKVSGVLALPPGKVYCSLMIYVIAGGFAILVVAAQAMLLRAVTRTASGAMRGALLSVKLPLWAGFFIVLALVDRQALLAGGAVAGVAYPGMTIWWMLRLRKQRAV